ncbi:MAG: rhodanese-like domain-containing protein [Deltaproteobacteria bacterium]|nr:rhodanese-like domain-containing protein [Deltaproteobacteria bacterium]MBI3294097.1 rhodanese-like domain-containing protein [Deltaproteobacteria bacterium]
MEKEAAGDGSGALPGYNSSMGLFGKLTRSQNRAITGASTLKEIETAYPGFADYCQRRYRLNSLSPGETLEDFARGHRLPSAQILLAEFQVSGRVGDVHMITAEELKARPGHFQILDVRENWEKGYGSIPNSRPLDAILLKEIRTQWPKTTPIVVYCHFGVRSLDAAVTLTELGLKNVSVLQGGVDAWAQVDSTVTRYEHAWC